MKIHVLQHVPFENEANIGVWAGSRGHTVTRTLLDERENYPPLHSFDWLVVMGGPMNVDEEDQYPWLRGEKKFIEKAISSDKLILGICLGAQLIARVLGAKVRKNQFKEIGWFPVHLTKTANQSDICKDLPHEFVAFHWHGDTFEIPKGGVRLAESEACRNQAFQYGARVLGLQFHLESSKQSVSNLIEHAKSDMTDGKFVQSVEEIYGGEKSLSQMKNNMEIILDAMEKLAVPQID